MRHARRKRKWRPRIRLPCKHATVVPRGFADLPANQLRDIHAAFERTRVFEQLDEWRYLLERLTVPVGRPEAIPLAAYVTITAALPENIAALTVIAKVLRRWPESKASDGWVYCCALVDAFSHWCVGWAIAKLVTDAFVMALRQRHPNWE